MIDKEPSAEAKEQARTIVRLWHRAVGHFYDLSLIDGPLTAGIAAALDAKDQEIAKWKDLREQDQRSARYAIDERDALAQQLEEAVRRMGALHDALVGAGSAGSVNETALEIADNAVMDFLSSPNIAKLLEKQK